MEKLQTVMQKEEIFWVGFDSRKKCKDYLNYLKRLGYKWFTGKEISNKEILNFYFTLEVNSIKKTVGYVPNFQRFARKTSN